MSFPGKVNVFLTLPPGRGYNKTNWGAAPWMEAVPMAKIVKKSPVPLYLTAALWIVWALLGPMYALWHFLLLAGLSIAVFWAARRLFRDRVLVLPDPEPEAPSEPVTTGNPEMDALMAERDRAVSEMRRLNDSIEDETISAQIDHLEEITSKIIDQVIKEPSKLPQIRRFLNYYLPTTLKILNAYDRMDAAGVSGDNIDSTKQRVERMMGTIVKAFDKQLDALFGAEAMDISTDITVMENLLAQEGLAGEGKTTTKSQGNDVTLEL